MSEINKHGGVVHISVDIDSISVKDREIYESIKDISRCVARDLAFEITNLLKKSNPDCGLQYLAGRLLESLSHIMLFSLVPLHEAFKESGADIKFNDLLETTFSSIEKRVNKDF